jgi:ABC-2 type transport system permease protein
MNNYIQNFIKYRHLLKELVIRDIKVKYKRSILGLLWTLLNPLFTMIVLSIVFSNIFQNNIENYPVYFIVGQVMFTFFSESTSMAMESIIGNSQLIKKVYIPKYIFPLSKVLSTFVNLLFALIAVILVVLVMKIKITIAIIFSPLALIYILIFSMGIGLILASINAFFRDMRHLYGVMLTAWMYLTPVFYPMNIIPKQYLGIVQANPLVYMIEYFRECMLYGIIPSLSLNLTCLAIGVVTLIIGLIVFYRSQDRFILYI